ncbi:cytochrome P450 [Polychytrium aggregatum]|uniref:cytochrome P450 n=1 Tax=Polychytrium aggregatum TaxID=110093 RepID=UPI0022FDE8B1|nr:cytochrome P450 [Polychytrium aggregatum]KAI9201864.1 cytochrome P450 [Polychytrium aggregatum]
MSVLSLFPVRLMDSNVHALLLSLVGYLLGIAVALALTCYVASVVYWLRSPLRKLPGAGEGFPSIFLGSFYWLFRCKLGKYHAAIRELHEKYGPVVALDYKVVSVSDPQLTKKIVYTLDLPKAPTYRKFKFTGTEVLAMFASNDVKYHRMLKRTIDQGLSIKALNSMEPLVQDCILNTIEYAKSIQDGSGSGRLDIWALASRFTVDVIGQVAYGSDFEMILKNQNEVVDSIYWIANYLSYKMVVPLFHRIPFLGINETNRRKTEYVNKIVKGLIHERKSGKTWRNDFLQHIIEATDSETGKHLSEAEIFANTLMLFLSGTESTSNTIGFAFIRLLTAPHALKKLQDELDGAELDPRTQSISYATAKNLPYLTAVLQETMRMDLAFAFGVGREATEDMDLGGHFIPKGTLINVALYPQHYNPKYWKDPDVFNPDRFLDLNDEGAKLQDMGFTPFSMGSRTCVGKNLAWMEMRLFIANFLRYFDITDIEGQSKEQSSFLTLSLKFPEYNIAVKPRKI